MERQACVCVTPCSIFANVSTMHPVPGLTLMYTLCIMYDLTHIHTGTFMNYAHVQSAAQK